MSNDLIEQLENVEVPQVPECLDQEIHRRVNHTLLVYHVLEFFFQAIPRACIELGRVTMGFVIFCLRGHFISR